MICREALTIHWSVFSVIKKNKNDAGRLLENWNDILRYCRNFEIWFVICRILTLDLTMKISHAHPKDHASRVFIWWWTVFLGTDQRTLLILNCRTSLSYNSQLLLMNACITKNLYLMFEALYCCYARRNLENARYSMVSKVWKPPAMAIPPSFISFFLNSILLTFFIFRPNKIRDNHKNKPIRETCFFMFRGLQNNIPCFFISNTLIYINRLKYDLK